MPVSYKSIALRRSVHDALQLRGLQVAEGFDDEGFPTVTVGTGAVGAEGAFIRVRPVPSINKDILGLDQRVFTPHIIQVAVEEGVNSWETTLPLLGELVALATKVEIWEEATGTAPSVTTFDTASKLKATYEDLRYPLVSSQ